MSIAMQDEVLPPAMSVCFDYHEMIIPEKLQPDARNIWFYEECFKFKSYHFLRQCSRILGNITYSEMLLNRTVHIPGMISKMRGEWQQVEGWVEYFRLGQKCIKLTLFKEGTKLLSLSDMDKMGYLTPKVLSVYFNVSFKSINPNFTHLRLGFGIHSSDTFLRFREGNFFDVFAERRGDNLFGIDGQLIDTRYLKHPFESNCADYDGKRTRIKK